MACHLRSMGAVLRHKSQQAGRASNITQAPLILHKRMTCCVLSLLCTMACFRQGSTTFKHSALCQCSSLLPAASQMDQQWTPLPLLWQVAVLLCCWPLHEKDDVACCTCVCISKAILHLQACLCISNRLLCVACLCISKGFSALGTKYLLAERVSLHSMPVHCICNGKAVLPSA